MGIGGQLDIPEYEELAVSDAQEPTGASAGEHNQKSTKRNHSRNRARLGAIKVEIGTTIVFNAK
jgi:hypothetical protein